MPRRRSDAPVGGEVALNDTPIGEIPILRLLTTPREAAPLAIPGRPHKRAEEGRIDAYAALAGGIADPERSPKKKKKDESQNIDSARYDAYVDALVHFDGNTVEALALVFRVSPEDAQLRKDELLGVIRSGAATNSVAALLERNDLNLAARIAVLRRHVYSPLPAASLKAIDMIENMAGEGETAESNYDAHVRALMADR